MLPLFLSLFACSNSSDVVPSAVAQPIPAVGATTSWTAPTGNNIRVDMLDVGQGDSILIRTPTKTILIDASEGVADVDDKLRALGVQGIDLAVATHPHADHIGGMDDVVRAIPIKMYMDNGLPHDTQTYTRLMSDIESKGITYRAAVAGTVINLDLGAKFEVLFPTGNPLTGTRSDLNANSVVTRLSYKDDCFLFMGDAEEPTERALISRGLGACEVLKVAHHGSEYSSIQSFLDVVRPDIALISVGKGNTYG
ncbi:MAG TPA: MBL fold metallo-hydrolase, partial [Myxococcota bacterium]|nr:MBL fold metallo-hydrolase [Myxococcota bacterium]